MERNIYDGIAYEAILRRIHDLKKDSAKQFGVMNVNEMLCHTADQLRMAMGYIQVPLEGNRISRYIKKVLALSMNRIPPERISTLVAIDPKKEGTKPVGFEDDRVTLIKLLDYLYRKEGTYQLFPHPIFGKLSKKQWAKIIYLHLDHHLKQFGV